MSSDKSAGKYIFLPVLGVVIFGLSFTLCVHQYSKRATAKTLVKIKTVTLEIITPSPAMAAIPSSVVATDKIEKETEIVAVESLTTNLTTANTPAIPADMEVAPGDPEQGRTTYMTCASCHGNQAEGNIMFNAPRLAGQEPWYLRKQLLKFKRGVRGTHLQDIYGMQMAPMAKLLFSDEIILNVIAYIGTLRPEQIADSGSGDPSKGKIFFAICASCHAPDAQGNPLHKAPNLTGQHAWYLARQLGNFKAGIRGSHEADIEGKLMLPIAQTLTDQQAIEDVVSYIQSLTP